MAITVNTTDTFEQWRVKTNQVSSDIDTYVTANVAAVRSDIASNVSVINSNIASNVSTINSSIAANALTINTSIVANVSTINTNISSNVTAVNSNIASNVSTINSSIASNVSTINSSIAANALTINTSITSNVSTLNTNISANVNNTSGKVTTGSIGVGTAASGTTGEIRATNDITAFYSSDMALKENIIIIDNPIEKIKALRGVYFDWTDDYINARGGEDGYFVRKKDVGVIAQEVEKVLPEIVAQRSDGNKAVKYDRLVSVLIEAVKELNEQVTDLREKLAKAIKND
jgi:hypothetical protein